MPVEFRIVTQKVDAPAEAAYAFAREVEHLPEWASGLAAGVEQVGGEWFAASPMGRIKLVMAPPNPFGVLDHDVTLPDGTVVHNAFRVTPVGDGALFQFVVLRAQGSADADFDRDVRHVSSDLETLARRLERRAAGGPRARAEDGSSAAA